MKGPGHLPALSCQGGDTVTLSGGVAKCTVTSLVIAQSKTSVVATYGGSSSYATSTSVQYTQTIGKDGTDITTFASKTATKATVTQKPAKFTAYVKAAAPGTGYPTGTVAWTIKGTSGSAITRCTTGNSRVNKKTGKVTCNIGAGKLSAALGPYTVTVVYPGNTTFTGTTASISHTVSKATSKTGAHEWHGDV